MNPVMKESCKNNNGDQHDAMAKSGVSALWERPEGDGPYPREWDSFEGARPMPDGHVARFWVRDLPPEELSAATAFMMAHYIREETMVATTRAADDPQSLADMQRMWRDAVARQRVSVAAYTDWPDGEMRIAGLNVLGVVRKEDPPVTMPGAKTAPMFELMNGMLAAADVFVRYGVSLYLVGLGLSVAPPFRGQGVARRLLRARRPLCAALGVPLTVTVFSGAASQKQSEREGFELLQSGRYADFVAADGSRPFADAVWPVIQLKAKFYGPRDDDSEQPAAAPTQ